MKKAIIVLLAVFALSSCAKPDKCKCSFELNTSIIDIELKGLKKRVKEAGFELTVTATAKRFVAEAGYDPSYGARPLKRAVQRYIEDPVSEHIIAERMLSGKKASEHTKISVSLSEDKESTKVQWR